MIPLSKEQLIRMHHALIRAFGGIDGLRSEGLLDSALAAPFQTFDGIDLYPSIPQKSARLAVSLVANHPF